MNNTYSTRTQQKKAWAHVIALYCIWMAQTLILYTFRFQVVFKAVLWV